MPAEVLKEKQAYVLSLVKQGLRRGEIIKKLGVSSYSALARIWKILEMDEAIKGELLRLKSLGKTNNEIEKEFNISKDSYYTLARKYDIPITQKKMLISKKDDIIAMRNQGMTKTEMAKIYGVTYQALSKAMNELEINTLRKETILNMKKSDLIALKEKYRNIHRISKFLNVSYSSVKKLFEFFGLK